MFRQTRTMLIPLPTLITLQFAAAPHPSHLANSAQCSRSVACSPVSSAPVRLRSMAFGNCTAGKKCSAAALSKLLDALAGRHGGAENTGIRHTARRARIAAGPDTTGIPVVKLSDNWTFSWPRRRRRRRRRRRAGGQPSLGRFSCCQGHGGGGVCGVGGHALSPGDAMRCAERAGGVMTVVVQCFGWAGGGIGR
jgi:hypothetical protein